MPAAQKIREPQNAVIYARFSSHSQTEQSIEGQLHDGYAYAERCGYNVIGEYIDRALTGTSDNRPDFQRMIKDAEKHQFQIVIVWKLDRFARNRFDSAVYKRTLKKHGVRVVSVMENITDSPEGIILEGLLEAMAEYYSANLSENIRRGQAESVKKGWYCGGSIPMGYRVQDHKLVRDEKTAPLVLELYQRYADGDSLAAIARDFNSRGYRTARGYPFRISTFNNILPNPSYLGEYSYSGQVIPGLTEPLIDRDLYDRVVARRNVNRRAPAANRSTVQFMLTGKLFCGLCGSPMSGSAGTGKHGERHYYYSCSARKRRLSDCKKKNERKDFIEWYVCEQTVQYILDPERMDHIAEEVANLYNSEINDDRLHELERTVRRLKEEVNSMVDKLVVAPMEAAPAISQRIAQLELQRADAETDLSKLRLQTRVKITKKEVAAWLSTFSRGDLFDQDFRSRLIDTFINSVYLYDDKVVIFYNLKGGKEVSAIEMIDEIEENQALEPGSPLSVDGGAFTDKDEPRHAFVFLHGMIGLVVFR